MEIFKPSMTSLLHMHQSALSCELARLTLFCCFIVVWSGGRWDSREKQSRCGVMLFVSRRDHSPSMTFVPRRWTCMDIVEREYLSACVNVSASSHETSCWSRQGDARQTKCLTRMEHKVLPCEVPTLSSAFRLSASSRPNDGGAGAAQSTQTIQPQN